MISSSDFTIVIRRDEKNTKRSRARRNQLVRRLAFDQHRKRSRVKGEGRARHQVSFTRTANEHEGRGSLPIEDNYRAERKWK